MRNHLFGIPSLFLRLSLCSFEKNFTFIYFTSFTVVVVKFLPVNTGLAASWVDSVSSAGCWEMMPGCLSLLSNHGCLSERTVTCLKDYYLNDSVSKDFQHSVEDSRFGIIHAEDLIITNVYFLFYFLKHIFNKSILGEIETK